MSMKPNFKFKSVKSINGHSETKWIYLIQFDHKGQRYEIFGYGKTKKASMEWTTEKLALALHGFFDLDGYLLTA